MALAPYYGRAALAAAQVLTSTDPGRFEEILGETPVEVILDSNAAASQEAVIITEFLVAVLARLYPALSLREEAGRFEQLALEINPDIDLDPGEPRFSFNVGGERFANLERTIFVGSNEWVATISTEAPRSTGSTSNPFGPALAAGLATSKLFRTLFLPGSEEWSQTVTFSTLSAVSSRRAPSLPRSLNLVDRVVLIGAGAVGNAAAWVLGRVHGQGQIHIVDPEELELSNMQRYVLGRLDDVGSRKVDLLRDRGFSGGVEPVGHALTWDAFTESQGYDWDFALAAVDSARVRRQIQATLPDKIVNAWTQPGDLGVSVHSDFRQGACLSCLYLPEGPTSNEDQLVAAALGIGGQQNELMIRGLLMSGEAAPLALLEQVSAALKVPMEKLEPYATRPLRDLYVEGVCGGDIISLDQLGEPTQDVHVPLVHQSAIAGVLVAANFVALLLGQNSAGTQITRINVLRSLPVVPTQAAEKDPRGICICQDEVYRHTYDEKFSSASSEH